MLKRSVSEARLTLTLEATGPLLVKSGHVTFTGPDMTPVPTYRNGEWQVFLPGSSLKGVFRSHLETVCRTLHQETVICDPFLTFKKAARVENGQLVCPNYPGVACSDRFELRRKCNTTEIEFDRSRWKPGNESEKEKLPNQKVYADSCPICRLFGSTSYIGRVSIGDAYLAGPGRTELRDGVGIDRLTGGAAIKAKAKFELEVVSPGVTFETEILLRNFETWQLGMLMLIVQDLADELIRVGSGRSRGLGAVTGSINNVAIAYLGDPNGRPTSEVWGLGQFLGEDSPYGTWADDVLALEQAPSEINRGVRRITRFSGESLADLQAKALSAFVSRIQGWHVPDTMKFEHLQFQQVGE